MYKKHPLNHPSGFLPLDTVVMFIEEEKIVLSDSDISKRIFILNKDRIYSFFMNKIESEIWFEEVVDGEIR